VGFTFFFTCMGTEKADATAGCPSLLPRVFDVFDSPSLTLFPLFWFPRLLGSLLPRFVTSLPGKADEEDVLELEELEEPPAVAVAAEAFALAVRAPEPRDLVGTMLILTGAACV